MCKNNTVPTKVEADNDDIEVPIKIDASHYFDNDSIYVHTVTTCDSSSIDISQSITNSVRNAKELSPPTSNKGK